MILPNPWMIIGAIVMAISVYFYGHHKGWAERDQEMQSEIAAKNEEARTKEQELTKQLNEIKTEINALGDELNRHAGSELRGEKGSLGAQRLAKCLYTVKGYPPQYKKEGGRKSGKKRKNKRTPSSAFCRAISFG